MMASKREKVVVAMSGGVDSSVAACLLVERGYDVIGLFMRVGAVEPGLEPRSDPSDPEYACGQPAVDKTTREHKGCCSASDAGDARFVAGMLGIPFYALNFEKDFDRIIDYFADEYIRGRTPNPCVVCNDQLKFGKIVDYADSVGAKYIATGHYARLGRRTCDPEWKSPGGSRRPVATASSADPTESVGEETVRNVLMRGRDGQKDQSYVLFGLKREILDRLMFPIGEYTKDQVRELAARFELPVQNKPDSVDICFVPDRDYARVVRERRPDAFASGDVVNADGDVLGTHKGIGHYTIGQRRGLGIAAGKPIYVTSLNVQGNTVTVGDRDDLLKPALVADRANFLVGPPKGPFRAEVKIRYLHRAAPATIYPQDGGRVRVVFDAEQRAITPGQAVVFYDGDVVLGGAWISRAEDAGEVVDETARPVGQIAAG